MDAALKASATDPNPNNIDNTAGLGALLDVEAGNLLVFAAPQRETIEPRLGYWEPFSS